MCHVRLPVHCSLVPLYRHPPQQQSMTWCSQEEPQEDRIGWNAFFHVAEGVWRPQTLVAKEQFQVPPGVELHILYNRIFFCSRRFYNPSCITRGCKSHHEKFSTSPTIFKSKQNGYTQKHFMAVSNTVLTSCFVKQPSTSDILQCRV